MRRVAGGLSKGCGVGEGRGYSTSDESLQAAAFPTGFHTGTGVANIEPLSVRFSISITSAAARFTEDHHLTTSPFVIAGIIALVWLALIALLYRSRKVPILFWPAARAQFQLPWRALAGFEWVVVIAAVLAFSPQTNTRHLVLTVFINLLGIALLLNSRGKNRWIAILSILGLLALWMALNLPPAVPSAAGPTRFLHRRPTSRRESSPGGACHHRAGPCTSKR